MTATNSSGFNKLRSVIEHVFSLASPAERSALQEWRKQRWQAICEILRCAGQHREVYEFVDSSADSLADSILDLLNGGFPEAMEAPIDYAEGLCKQAAILAESIRCRRTERTSVKTSASPVAANQPMAMAA